MARLFSPATGFVFLALVAAQVNAETHQATVRTPPARQQAGAALPEAPHAQVESETTSKASAPNSASAPEQGMRRKGLSQSGSPGHIFWVIPAFKVDYNGRFKPLTPKEKFQEWAQGVYDPLGLAAGAVEAATLQYSSKDGFCGYGHGWSGYGQCFGSSQLDSIDSSFIGDYLLPVLLHQDPRYFRLGHGSFARRVAYAVSRVFVTYNDSGHTVFDSSALSGTVAAAALSNLYYPKKDQGFEPSLHRAAIDLGNTALYNGGAEFWPDIHSLVHKVLGITRTEP